MERLPPAILLMGPTAAGKTDLAVRLVQELACDIISVDSAMVYREMDIGTAKPDDEVLRLAPHRLIDFLDPAEAYSAARFRTDALREMDQITQAGRIPLLVGGTMLYYKALEEGLAEMPQADPEIRKRITAQAIDQGWAALHRRLVEVDPVAGARIHPNDPQRIQRALEIYEVSGVTMTEHLSRQVALDPAYRWLKVVVAPADRALLHERIALRFRQMLDQGFVEEVERLKARGDLDLDRPSMRAVGYRQVWEYLDGNLSRDEMIERGIIATRQLAKRQFTWLRAQTDAVWFDPGEDNFSAEVLKFLREHTT